MAKGIIEMLTEVGEENIQVQSIHQSAKDYHTEKNGDLRITFYTAPADILAIAEGRRIGLVVWFDREKLKD